jgi:hypothetical protein
VLELAQLQVFEPGNAHACVLHGAHDIPVGYCDVNMSVSVPYDSLPLHTSSRLRFCFRSAMSDSSDLQQQTPTPLSQLMWDELQHAAAISLSSQMWSAGT